MSSTNRSAERKPHDAYATPLWAIDVILDEVKLDTITTGLEPACGDQRIIQAIEQRNSAIKFDWADIQQGIDYFSSNYKLLPYDLIISNPPYNLAQAFVDQALTHGKNVVMLLRLGFLASQKRREWWQDRIPHRLFVLSKRPSFTNQGTDSADYAWFCWGTQFRRPYGLYVL